MPDSILLIALLVATACATRDICTRRRLLCPPKEHEFYKECVMAASFQRRQFEIDEDCAKIIKECQPDGKFARQPPICGELPRPLEVIQWIAEKIYRKPFEKMVAFIAFELNLFGEEESVYAAVGPEKKLKRAETKVTNINGSLHAYGSAGESGGAETCVTDFLRATVAFKTAHAMAKYINKVPILIERWMSTEGTQEFGIKRAEVTLFKNRIRPCPKTGLFLGDLLANVELEIPEYGLNCKTYHTTELQFHMLDVVANKEGLHSEICKLFPCDPDHMSELLKPFTSAHEIYEAARNESDAKTRANLLERQFNVFKDAAKIAGIDTQFPTNTYLSDSVKFPRQVLEKVEWVQSLMAVDIESGNAETYVST